MLEQCVQTIGQWVTNLGYRSLESSLVFGLYEPEIPKELKKETTHEHSDIDLKSREEATVNKKIYITGCLICAVLLLSGCRAGHSVQIVDITEPSAKASSESKTSASSSDDINLELHGYKGDMTFELMDTYVTANLSENGIDVNNLGEYSCVGITENGIYRELSYPDYLTEDGKMADNCRIFVCRIKVTNVNAVSTYKDYYGGDYIFSVDNLTLNDIDDDKVLNYYGIDYYSLKKDDDHTWSTFELRPGKSLIYEIGFVVGNAFYAEDGTLMNITADDISHFYLGTSTDGSDGTYYKVDWKER